MSTNDHSITVDGTRAPGSPYTRDVTPKTNGCLTCLKGVLIASGTLVVIAICVSSICFGISGAVFLGEEYTAIPDCASSFRGWSIAMTILFILGADSARKSTSKDHANGSMRALGAAFVIMSFIPGLIAGLGNRDVLKAHDGCDRSAIPQLITWTEWIVVYNVVMFALMVLGGGVLMCSDD
jgi:hypothetical protein